MALMSLDKAAHAWAGAAIAATLLPFVGWWALLVAACAAAAKELWDHAGNGSPDPIDFWATVAGAVCAALAQALIFNLANAPSL